MYQPRQEGDQGRLSGGSDIQPRPGKTITAATIFKYLKSNDTVYKSVNPQNIFISKSRNNEML